MKPYRGRLNTTKDKIYLHFWCPLSQFDELRVIQERREKRLPDRCKDNFSDTLRYIVALGLAEDRRRNSPVIDEMKNKQDYDAEKPSVTYKGSIPIIEGIRLIEHD